MSLRCTKLLVMKVPAAVSAVSGLSRSLGVVPGGRIVGDAYDFEVPGSNNTLIGGAFESSQQIPWLSELGR